MIGFVIFPENQIHQHQLHLQKIPFLQRFQKVYLLLHEEQFSLFSIVM